MFRPRCYVRRGRRWPQKSEKFTGEEKKEEVLRVQRKSVRRKPNVELRVREELKVKPRKNCKKKLARGGEVSQM